ncbi:MAG: barstar family protein [Alphaproteobacteria bacterium]
MNPKSPKAKRAVIPANCKTLDGVYDILVRDLALPAHFGRNLDALYDVLARDVEGPFAIAVADAKALEEALGAKGPALIKLLRDVAKARKDAAITLGPPRRPAKRR